MLNYNIKASVTSPGKASALSNNSEIFFDATSGRDTMLPNPAELLLTSLAACILKNVQRYSEILKIPYQKAEIVVNGNRNDNPPFIEEIYYKLKIQTDANEHQINNWHKNIIKFGTITNTLSKACKLHGEIIKIKL